MAQKILILGGGGRIGQAVAMDLLRYTRAEITLCTRDQNRVAIQNQRESVLGLELADQKAVVQAIQNHHLVIHCAGPFRDRDHHVLKTCIEHRIPYMDVADSPDYVAEALKLHSWAVEKQSLAVLSTGVFPGISSSLVRQGIEQLDQAHEAHLSYLVAGSGGAGVTVMRTTFIELQAPFRCIQQGKQITIQPYSDREVQTFPVFGRGGVYWFNTIEALTLPISFPQLQTVSTKFGSVPDIYNYLTWLVAKAPKAWLKKSSVIEFLSHVSYRMTQVSDRFSGTGLAMKAEVLGIKDDQPARVKSTFYCEDTAIGAGQGAGMVAQFILDGVLDQPGVWPVEQILSTPLFEQAMMSRGLKLDTVVELD